MTLQARIWIVFLSLTLFSLVLTDLPLGAPWHWWAPQWVLLTIIFLRLHSPLLMGLKRAWLIGFFLDILLGGLIGRYALICTFVSFVAGYIRLRFKIYAWWQQSLLVGLLIVVAQLLLFCLQSMIGHAPQSGLYWGSAITSVLCWPILSMVYRILLNWLFLPNMNLR